MTKTKSKSWNIYKGMSLYLRNDSPRYYGCLRIDGRYYRRCLNTENKNEAEKLLFQWKNDIYTDPDSPLSDSKTSFFSYAQRLIQKEKRLPPRPSGVEQWTDTQRLLSRKNGLLDIFGNKNIHSISVTDIEDFFVQLPLNNRLLTTTYLNKHKNLLKKILESAGITNIVFPRYRGKRSEPRGYFNLQEYKKLRDASKDLVGMSYTNHNGSKYQVDEDLHSLIVFMVGSMLRPTVSEIYSLTHKDITIKDLNSINYLDFPVTRKNRKMVVQTLPTAFYAYENILQRRPHHKKSDYLFAPQYENRRTAMRYLSNMFAQLLRELDMSKGRLGEERSLYSLRHTSLIFNLSQPNVDLLDIARRADTSMKMIQDYYYPQSQLDEKLKDFLRI